MLVTAWFDPAAMGGNSAKTTSPFLLQPVLVYGFFRLTIAANPSKQRRSRSVNHLSPGSNPVRGSASTRPFRPRSALRQSSWTAESFLRPRRSILSDDPERAQRVEGEESKDDLNVARLHP
jgi:hypothetical protein